MSIVKLNNRAIKDATAVGSITALGNLIFISKQTASSSANVSFTSGIDSTYKEYIFTFNNIHPSTTANFTFQVNASGQTGFNETITSTVFRAQHTESDSTASLDYKTNLDQAQGTSYQVIGEQISAGSDESCSGKLHLFDPSSDTFVKHFMTNFSGYVDGTTSHNNFTAGYINTTSAITQIDFKMSSGNIDAGTISLYGVV
jgi:hypothetical protein